MRKTFRRLCAATVIGVALSLPSAETAQATEACPGNVVKNGDTGCHLTQDNGDNTGNYKCDDNTSYTLNCTTLKQVPREE